MRVKNKKAENKKLVYNRRLIYIAVAIISFLFVD